MAESKPTEYSCSACGKSYKYSRNLRQHASRRHPDKLNEIAPLLNSLKTYNYQCHKCEKRFNHLCNLKSHEKFAHGVPGIENIKCVLCEFQTHLEELLFEHLTTSHDVDWKCEELDFSSIEDFKKWKHNLEKDTHMKYVQKRGTHVANDNTIRHYYICHRTGYFVSKSKGLRCVKIQGSKKINGICPSSIRVFQFENGSCKVMYFATHLGHDLVSHHQERVKNDRLDGSGVSANLG